MLLFRRSSSGIKLEKLSLNIDFIDFNSLLIWSKNYQKLKRFYRFTPLAIGVNINITPYPIEFDDHK